MFPVVELGSATSVDHNLRLVPNAGKPWVAAVRGENYGVYFALRPTPDPDVVCVVAGGGAYLVDVVNHHWRALDVFPVTQVVEVPDANVMVFASFGDLAGFGDIVGTNHERVWFLPQLVLDDLEVVSVDGALVECRAHTYETMGDGPRARFVIDAATGAVVEGLPPRRGFFTSLFTRKD